MEKIPSFTIDHCRLLKGAYVSRIDRVGEHFLTTYDLRMKQPNVEPVINTGEIHALEHMGATYLRNHPDIKEDVIYFGPMGCRTGFYLILKGKKSSEDILPLLKELFTYMSHFEGLIPGASAMDCGNYLDMNLPMAKYEADKYLDVLQTIKYDQLVYPK
jgi:S-ribosylhomocysteine lyase